MGNAGGVLGVVLGTGADGDFGVEARLFCVMGQIDCQAVVQLVDMGRHGVFGIRAVE